MTQHAQQTHDESLKVTLPTGRLKDGVIHLLEKAGLSFTLNNERSYRPACSDPRITAKMLRSQNIPELVALGRHDCGFCGYDWIVEQDVESRVVQLLDLELNPVRLVVAMPEDVTRLLHAEPKRQLIVASEYRKIAHNWISAKELNAVFVQAYGTTEALPPEDADIIIDNTASGETLAANKLVIFEQLLQSTTRFVCNRQALDNPAKRNHLEEMTMLMASVLLARQRVLLKMNVSPSDLEKVVRILPSMRAPTISRLHGDDGYAIEAVVPAHTASLIPRLVAHGARDILELYVGKIVAGE